ncbi:MAG: Cysteine desulfurase SufS [Chlamydiia bacterium]|nr:Cysteine desulfurase SufS [Chlamydiia bacterium]
MINYRSYFPFLVEHPEIVYLDHAATSHKLQSVIETLTHFYTHQNATIHRTAYPLSLNATNAYHATRVAIAKLLNAKSPDEIIFTKGTTDSINLVAKSYAASHLEPGDEILITEGEHHSNMVPWQQVAREKGLTLRILKLDENGEISLDQLKKHLTPKLRLIAIAHVFNATGVINPIEQILTMAHANGTKVLIDGAQAVSHIQIDVQALDVDFYAFSGAKVFGPTGVGVLYAKQEHLETMPPIAFGGDMVETVTLDEAHFQRPPLRFEAGTPNIADVIALHPAITFLQTLDYQALQAHLKHLRQMLVEKLRANFESVKIFGEGEEMGPIVTFVIPPYHPYDLGTLLGTKGICIRTGHLCAQPTLQHFKETAFMRASLALTTTPEEIDQLITGLKESIEML